MVCTYAQMFQGVSRTMYFHNSWVLQLHKIVLFTVHVLTANQSPDDNLILWLKIKAMDSVTWNCKTHIDREFLYQCMWPNL